MGVLKIRNSSDDGWIVLGGFNQNIIRDDDGDTYIDCETSADEDIIHAYVGGAETLRILGPAGSFQVKGTTPSVFLTRTDNDSDYFLMRHNATHWILQHYDTTTSTFTSMIQIGIGGELILTGSGIVKDEDDMTSDSTGHLCTQQSIKAYAGSRNNHVDVGGISGASTYTLYTPADTQWTDFTIVLYAVKLVGAMEPVIQFENQTTWHVLYYGAGSSISTAGGVTGLSAAATTGMTLAATYMTSGYSLSGKFRVQRYASGVPLLFCNWQGILTGAAYYNMNLHGYAYLTSELKSVRILAPGGSIDVGYSGTVRHERQ